MPAGLKVITRLAARYIWLVEIRDTQSRRVSEREPAAPVADIRPDRRHKPRRDFGFQYCHLRSYSQGKVG